DRAARVGRRGHLAAHLAQAPAFDREVARAGGGAGSVHDARVADDEIEHDELLVAQRSRIPSRRRQGWPRSASALSAAQSSSSLRAWSASRVTVSQAPLAWRTRTTSTACPSWPGATIAASITGSACASACIGSARVGERRLDEDHVAAQELAGRD